MLKLQESISLDVSQSEQNDMLDETLLQFKERMALEPKNPQLFLQLGRIFREQQRFEDALYYFLRAEVLESSLEVYFEMAVLFVKKKNHQKALEYFYKAEHAGKADASFYQAKGALLERMKDLRGAVESYIQSYHLHATLDCCHKIAPLALDAGLYAEAIRFYEYILEHESKPLYYAEMGLAYLKLEMYEKSKACYMKAKELSHIPKKYEHIDKATYEDFVAKYPNLEKALESLTNRIAKGKASFEDHYELGNMLFIKEDYEKSLEAYQEARTQFLNNRKEWLEN